MVDRRWLLAQAGAVGGPLLVLLAARVMLSPPAAVSASGAAAQAPEMVVLPTVPPLTSEQKALVQWANAIDLETPLSSPLAHLRSAPVSVSPVVTPVEPRMPTEGLVLRGVIGGGSATVASISGRIYRVGDEVRPGLRIQAIDATTHTVDLVTEDGSMHRLMPVK